MILKGCEEVRSPEVAPGLSPWAAVAADPWAEAAAWLVRVVGREMRLVAVPAEGGLVALVCLSELLGYAGPSAAGAALQPGSAASAAATCWRLPAGTAPAPGMQK